MANDEVLGPRKTMFVLVIVVGCFAVLWPRILSPLILGHSQEQLKPNKFDREAGCCEVMFEKEVAVLELINEVCSSVVGVGGKLSPYSAAECRRAVNETCGVDIAAFLKRSENVGKTTRMLIETMKSTNSSCIKEHFGVQLTSLNVHPALNSWTQQDTLKQERSPIRGMGPHPALRERGRAIPPGSTPQPQQKPAPLPPHVRVRTSPLSVYYQPEAKPPPIPGMRPPLGSPGGPVPAPKSSMGFVMPIYTICIIVFFVYTLSKILFKRSSAPYEGVAPDPQFRRRVFRDDSRATPDKLGPKERDARDVELEALRARLAETERAMQRIVGQLARRDAVSPRCVLDRTRVGKLVTAISGLVAEVQQQMEASDAQYQQRQEAQDNARPYTNGTILLNSGPVQIIASEFQEPKQTIPDAKDDVQKESTPEPQTPQSTETVDDVKVPEPIEVVEGESRDEKSPEADAELVETEKLSTELIDAIINVRDETGMEQESENLKQNEYESQRSGDNKDPTPEIGQNDSSESPLEKAPEVNGDKQSHGNLDIIALSEGLDLDEDKTLAQNIEQLIKEERGEDIQKGKQSTPELLEEALQDDSIREEQDDGENADKESSSVKVLGMEVTAHTADGAAWPRSQAPLTAPPPQRPTHEARDVKSIFLETEIPQQSRVLVADFEENRSERPKPTKNAPLVVSGKMTLSLIQDAPRETPERDPESTVDDFTTASAMTQPNAEKEDDLSDEEIEEEIEIEEIEEEIEEEEEEEDEPKNAPK
ncbi:unnamed protein product, partial [Iphiclides podalirius]